jgi:predicted transcriptional regulator of viral defense system
MEFETLLDLVDDDPVFESSLLLSGNVNPSVVRLQLNRWVKSGRIYQLRRGLYAIAPPYQKAQPHPFLVANHLQRASYVSFQSALAFYGLIPETVNITVSATTGRPERLETPLGIYEFRHIKADLLFGYRMTDLADQNALVATPEKALLDLVYLHAGGGSKAYLDELRLQNPDRIDVDVLQSQSNVFDSPKLYRAVEVIANLIKSETSDYEEL